MSNEEKKERKPTAYEEMKASLAATRDWLNNSRFGKTLEWLGDNFGAWFRQGMKEIAQILAAFPDGVRPVEELGTMGNPTQWEVNQERGNVYGKDGVQPQAIKPATVTPVAAQPLPAKPLFERDPGFEEWCDQQAAMQPPSQEMGREM